MNHLFFPSNLRTFFPIHPPSPSRSEVGARRLVAFVSVQFPKHCSWRSTRQEILRPNTQMFWAIRECAANSQQTIVEYPPEGTSRRCRLRGHSAFLKLYSLSPHIPFTLFPIAPWNERATKRGNGASPGSINSPFPTAYRHFPLHTGCAALWFQFPKDALRRFTLKLDGRPKSLICAPKSRGVFLGNTQQQDLWGHSAPKKNIC